MTSQRWLVFAISAAVAACSDSNESDACSPSNVVDDPDLASGEQSLSASEQLAVASVIDGLFGLRGLGATARTWSEAPRSAERALVRDFVETVLIDADQDAAARFSGAAAAHRIGLSAVDGSNAATRYTALRGVVSAGDLVLARSDGERAGVALELHDLFRVAGGRVVERWSAERPLALAGTERAGLGSPSADNP